MMRWINMVLVFAVLAAGFVSYTHEHQTRQLERKIAHFERDIDAERETIKLLQAEWSSLIKPTRLQSIADETLDFVPMKPEQIISEDEIAARVPAEPIIKLEAENEDAIGSILEKMQ
jgi:cell division protein FtsL